MVDEVARFERLLKLMLDLELSYVYKYLRLYCVSKKR
jgi:hypothetical protein